MSYLRKMKFRRLGSPLFAATIEKGIDGALYSHTIVAPPAKGTLTLSAGGVVIRAQLLSSSIVTSPTRQEYSHS